MTSITLLGEITVAEVETFLLKCFPERNVKVSISSSNRDDASGTENAEINRLKKLLAMREHDQKEMEESMMTSAQAIQKLHQQQRALFDEFALLRNKYDSIKDSLSEVLWEQCTKHHPELDQIPYLDTNFDENDESSERIGMYQIGERLGEGQFATVYTCTKENPDVQLALKRFEKDRITSFTELRNISNEISILKTLDSKFIVAHVDAMQTKTKLYIIMEKGGPDLFEFFGSFPDGIREDWAQEIIGHVVTGITYCHLKGICHRDLKPENVLLNFNLETGRVENLKICDFGLGSKFSPMVPLSDFCGSPGFFPPEMLLDGEYYGDKVDVWSIGCIALELLLGHDIFSESWLSSYQHHIIQSKISFERRIAESVNDVPPLLQYSSTLKALIQEFITINPKKRPRLTKLCQNSWFGLHIAPEVLMQACNYEDFFGSSPTKKRNSIGEGGLSGDRRGSAERRGSKVRQRIDDIKMLSEAERSGERSGRFKSIEPETPTIGAAKSILQSGQYQDDEKNSVLLGSIDMKNV